MASSVNPYVTIPNTVSAGQVFTIKTEIRHSMESGHRLDDNGIRIPRSIIHRFSCQFDGESVVDVALAPALSPDPVFCFDAAVQRAGTFHFKWYDDDGDVYELSKSVAVV